MTNLKDKRHWIKPGQWCWVVQNEDENRQRRYIALILEKALEGEVWITYRDSPNGHVSYKTGIVSTSDIIILHNCTGWDYQP